MGCKRLSVRPSKMPVVVVVVVVVCYCLLLLLKQSIELVTSMELVTRGCDSISRITQCSLYEYVPQSGPAALAI
jgi:hypothetical protein